jgi:hypothetical protein
MRAEEGAMPRTKSKPKRPVKPTMAETPNGAVLTLSEVAAYLRVMEARVEELVREQNWLF